MPFKFNPFSGNFDQTGSGGGGGSSYIDGEVATYNDLPLDGTAPLNSAWLVRSSSGIWPFNKPAGIYYRSATAGVSRDADYTYGGTLGDVFADNVFVVYGNGNSTRNLQFDVDTNVPNNTTVTLTAPAASGTIARTETFAAPPAIGSTTPSTGAFTTLSATPSSGSALTLTGGTITASAPLIDATQTWNASGTTFTGLRFNLTPTAYDHRSLIVSLEESSTPFWGIQSIIGVPPSQAVRIFGGSRGLRIGSRQTGAAGGADFIGIRYQLSTFAMLDGTEFGWSTQPYDSAPNLALHRDAADTLAQRRTTNPQAYRIYNTFTDANNHERGFLRWSSNVLQIGTEKGSGGGTARNLELRTDNTARLTVGSAGTVTLNTTLAADAQNISTDTTTGTKIGTGTTQKIGFFNATPVVQQAAVADATDAASTQARLNDLLARLRTLGLIAT